MQENKKQLEEKVEALRTVKETAEQPEKEAKERHLKAWEGECSCLIVKSNAYLFKPDSLSPLRKKFSRYLYSYTPKVMTLWCFVCKLI